MRNRLGLFLAISLLINLIVLVLITDPTFQKLIPLFRPPSPPPPPPPSLTLLKMEPPPSAPPKNSFIPTLPSQAVTQADPNARLESERNTEQRSREAAKDPNSPLPALSGAKNPLAYQDVARSPEVKSRPSQPSEAVRPTPPAQPPQPKPAAQAAPRAQPVPAPELRPDAEPILPPEEKKVNKNETPDEKPAQAERAEPVAPTPQPPQPPQQAQQPPSPASPPPSAPAFAQRKSDLGGGARNIGDPSPQSRETEIGRYKAKLYRMIGSRWYHNVDQSMTLLGVGTVRCRFYVQSNGLIDPRQIQILDSNGQADILQGICLDAVQRAYGEPFSDSMRQQLGDGFWEEITFSIY